VDADARARPDEKVIRYSGDASSLEPRQLRGGFFEGWSSRPDAERHLRILRGSDHVVVALDGDQVVGFVTAITDGVLAAFIPLLEVLPAYRGRGIGTELMRRLLTELSSYPDIDLSCDAELQPFYARLGMQPGVGMYIREPNRWR
jgi:ribosomal protein S18 acetylase RimI-like enzyme